MLEKVETEQLDAMAEAAEAYVQRAFGQRLDLTPIAPTNLPHFVLDRYRLWSGTISGRSLILMALREPRHGATTEYLKHRGVVRHQLHADLVVLLLDKVTNAIRHQMINRQIGFLAPGAQLYIPEAFLDLRERASATTIFTNDDPISPTTQLVLLAQLHHFNAKEESLTELAHRFEVAIMSMSRTLDELEKLQLAKPRNEGRRRVLSMTVGGRELWDAVRDRLKSPVRKVRTVTGEISDHIAPRAGESALATLTMLAEPRSPTRAVPASHWKRFEAAHHLLPATPLDDDRMQVETWSYDPTILAQNGVVDRLSLYLSVRASADERVAQAADELLETFEW